MVANAWGPGSSPWPPAVSEMQHPGVSATAAPAAEVVLFAGPTLQHMPAALLAESGVQLRPPVRRGDIDSLVDQAVAPAVVIVCDGVFESTPAVSHAELCRAIDAGWQVWGVSSLGAIRAHELRGEGMRGEGWVHAQFSLHEDFTDDELCLLHLPEPTYLALSEPLVNLRYALAVVGPDLGIGNEAAAAWIAALQSLWFGDRTLDRLRQVACRQLGLPPAAVQRLLGWMAAHPIKSLDLRLLLRQRPWSGSASVAFGHGDAQRRAGAE